MVIVRGFPKLYLDVALFHKTLYCRQPNKLMMVSLISDTLFNSSPNRKQREEVSCNASPNIRYRDMFGPTSSLLSSTSEKVRMPPRMYPGPQPSLRSRDVIETVGDFPSLTSIPSSSTNGIGGDISFGGENKRAFPGSANNSEVMNLKVVKENDVHRGFRMFDGMFMSVKDVSSEELFLERMKIVYSAYDAYVAGLVNRSPLEITKGLVRAVSACLTKYFTTQSMLRTNRPFIAKVLNLDCPDMFCTHSNFMQSFLFTNASPEDEAIISLAENVYAENNFDVCTEYSNTNDQSNAEDASATDQLFDFGMRIAERSVVGGTNTSYGSDRNASSFATLSDELPFQQRKDGAGQILDGGTTAMLIMVTDFEALHNYVAYVLYLTPAQLTRRYNINFDCLRRPMSKSNLDCCRARESKKRKRDNAKIVIRAVIEKKRREKIDTMVERSAACEATLQQLAAQTLRRSNDLLCHVLLMLFDKCLSGLIDKGFENLNARRGYAVNSAKEIGSATIYTGIIDTVGEVSAHVEGYTFEDIVKNAASNQGDLGKEGEENRHQLRFSLPLSSIITEVSTNRGTNGKRNNSNDSEM